MLTLALVPVVAALALPPEPSVDSFAISVSASSTNGEAALTIPLSALQPVSPGRVAYHLPAPMALLAPDGFTAIAAFDSLSVEYTGESTIRLEFVAHAGNVPTDFSITSGFLNRPSAGGGRLLARARMIYSDNGGDGGGITGHYFPELLPVAIQYAFRAYVNEPSPLPLSFASLLMPISAPMGITGGRAERIPADGDFALSFVPLTNIRSAFSFTLSPLDTTRASSVYFISANGRCTVADFASIGGEDLPDGQLTADDLIVYLAMFFASDPFADLVGPGGVDITDGQITPDDLVAFIAAFFAGCPQ